MRTTLAIAWTIGAVLAASPGCGGGGTELAVDLRTDARPEADFVEVRTTITGPDSIARVQTRAVGAGDDYLEGVRVAELGDPEKGLTTVDVDLLKEDETVFLGRRVTFEMQSSRKVDVVITSDCADLECPRDSDDPTATECVAGECVPPDCADPACGDPECESSEDCASAIECVDSVCVAGICLDSARDDRCDDPLFCEPRRGCVLQCMEDADCGLLDEEEPTCSQHYCDLASGTCMAHEDEICDGLDNDCDGVVDEPAASGAQTLTPSGEMAVGDVEASGPIATTSFGSGPVAAWTLPAAGTRPNAARVAPFGDAPVALGYATNESATNLRDLALADGCRRQSGDSTVLASCNFSDVALARLAGEPFGLVASVQTNGCAAGQLRLGHIAAAAASDPTVVMRGPQRRSNTYLGVDPTDTGVCTGGSRPDCVTAIDNGDVELQKQHCGAARPAVAALDAGSGRFPQALVAFLASAFGPGHEPRGECGGSETDVEVLGAFLETGLFAEEFHWVTGSNEGKPRILGSTRGGGAPGVTAWGDRGYLVGFGAAATGALALHWVPRAPEPADYDGVSCCMADCAPGDPNTAMCSGPDDRSDVLTDPLAGVTDVGPLAAGFGGPVDDVAFAPGATEGDRLEVGVAWRESCGDTDEIIAFRRIVLDLGGAPSLAEASDPVRLDGAGLAGPPAIVYVPSGFVTESFSRDGATATGDDLGGWWVAWSRAQSIDEPRQVVARRVSELDGEPLGDAERVVLGPAEGGSGRWPSLRTGSGGEPRFLYYDAEGSALVEGALTCGP